MKILYIDKDKTYSENLKNYLVSKGIDVALMDNAFDALACLKLDPTIDLIVLEINLPEFDGYKFIEQMQKENIGEIPFVILSRFNRTEDIIRGMQCGARDYIFKNIGLEKIYSKISNFLAIISEVNSLAIEKSSLSGNLSEVSILDILQIMQLSRKTGKITLNTNDKTGYIYTKNGELYASKLGVLEGEPALYTMLGWIKGEFDFTPLPQFSQAQNLHISMSSALLNGTKFIDELESKIHLIPIRTNSVSNNNGDIKSNLYLSLIDNKSSVYEITQKQNLNKYESVYYYLRLEENKKCKLIERENIPDENWKELYSQKDKFNILIVDDSKLMLKELEKLCSKATFIDKIEKASGGKQALEKIKSFKPDIVTLDVNMPDMDGITVLKHQMLINPIPVLMLSAFTTEGSTTTFESLRYGAADFYTKPVKNSKTNILKSQKELLSKIENVAKINVTGLCHVKIKKTRRKNNEFTDISEKLVIIGASKGSYTSLLQTLLAMPGNLESAIVTVLYMEKEFIQAFVDYLNKTSEMKFKLAENGEKLMNGICYFVPYYQYAKFEKSKNKYKLFVNKKPFGKEHEYSINIAMFSAAETFNENCTGVLISGASDDGAEGLREIKRNGGYTIVQNPSSCLQLKGPVSALKINAVVEMSQANRISEKIINAISNSKTGIFNSIEQVTNEKNI